MRNLFATLFNRGRTAGPNPQVRTGIYSQIPGSLVVSPEAALSLASCWAAVQLVTNAIACSEFHVHSLDANGIRTAIHGTPEAELLNWTPNPEMTPSFVKSWLVRDALAWGCGYAEVVRNGAGRPVELWPWYAERVVPYRDVNWNLIYQYTDDAGQVNTLPASRVLVVQYGRNGESVLKRAARALALTKAQEDFALQHFAGGVDPSTVIVHSAKLTPRQRQEFIGSLEEQHAGPGKGSRALILDGGAKFQEVKNLNLAESQLLEARKFALAEIGRIFGIHPALLGDDLTAQGYGANQIAFLLHSWRNGILPVAVAFQEAVTRTVFRPRSPYFAEIDLEWYVSGGRAAQSAADLQDVGARILTINEVRANRGLGGVSWGEGPEAPAIPTAPEPVPPGEGEPKAPPPPPHAAQNLATQALNRYARTLAARRADLARSGKSEAEIASNLETLAPRVIEDLSDVLSLAGRSADGISTAAASVAAGVEPAKAAAHLLAG